MILEYIFEKLKLTSWHSFFIELVVEAILEPVVGVGWVDAQHLVVALEHVDNFLGLLLIFVLLFLR